MIVCRKYFRADQVVQNGTSYSPSYQTSFLSARVSGAKSSSCVPEADLPGLGQRGATPHPTPPGHIHTAGDGGAWAVLRSQGVQAVWVMFSAWEAFGHNTHRALWC